MRTKGFSVSLVLATLSIGSNALAQEATSRLDVIFINGTLIDGSGAARMPADVGIVGDTIEVIGWDLEKQYDADRVIDISGKFITPGYIDVHTHTAPTVMGDSARDKAALNLVFQGITTVAVGADGSHSRKYSQEKQGQIAKQIDFVRSNGFGMNTFFLLGHNNIRLAVMGDDDYERFSTPAEWREMASYVKQYMQEGAMGMSLGLEYRVGRWSDKPELIALAEALADYDKRSAIVAHERATGAQNRFYLPSEHNAVGLYGDRFEKYPEGWDVIDYVKEAIEIAEKTGIVYDLSHLKITHESYFGKSKELIALVKDARARGVKIYAERIPFRNSGNSPLNLTIIPVKYYGETVDDTRRRNAARSPVTESQIEYDYSRLQSLGGREAEDLRADIAWQIDKHGGGGSVDVIHSISHPELIGKSLNMLSREWRLPNLVDVVLRIKENGDPNRPNGAIFRSRHTLSMEDTENFARQDWVGSTTDAGVTGLEGGFAQPRYFGGFTRKITLLVKENNVISLEHAIRAGTGLPASWLSLHERGLLREGWKADIQVFDFDELEVKARWTLEDSRAYSEGMYYVLVNGVFTLDNQKPTFNLPGTPITNQQAWTEVSGDTGR